MFEYSCDLIVLIRKDDKGNAVKQLQVNLGIKPDGDFGVMTKSALIAYQKANGLIKDGVYGPKTKAKLDM